MPIIYLAPANHYNAYCVAGYDEKTQCEKLSTLIAAKLAEYTGVTVKYTTVFAESRDYKGRPEEAAALGADYYIAVHDTLTTASTAVRRRFITRQARYPKSSQMPLQQG